jgi:hypothetical protein
VRIPLSDGNGGSESFQICVRGSSSGTGLEQEGGSLGLPDFSSTNSLAVALGPLSFSDPSVGTQRLVV